MALRHPGCFLAMAEELIRRIPLLDGRRLGLRCIDGRDLVSSSHCE